MSKNTIDLNEYKNSQEDIEAMALDIPDELIDAYLNEVEINTPDLWSKIETGYEKELKLIDSENKTRRKKVIGFIAAAVVIVVIAIPVAIFNVAGKKESKKEETTENKEFSFNYEESADSDDYEVDEAYMEAEDTTEAYEEQESDSASSDTREQYSSNVIYDNKNSEKTDNAEGTADEAFINENEIAKEIVFNGITYIDTKEAFVDTLPEEFDTEAYITNDFCSYPEEELTVIWTGNKDDCDYIYVCYKDFYRLYLNKDKAEN